DRQVGIGVIAGQFVTLRAQPRDNALGIDQRLRTAERYERDAGGPINEKLRFAVRVGARASNWDHEPQRSSATRIKCEPNRAVHRGRVMPTKIHHAALLLVTDRRQARGPLDAVVAAALSAGCRWVSVREKDLPADEQILLARSLLPLVRAQHGKLMLHGEASLARDAGIDGVHLPAGREAAAAPAPVEPEGIPEGCD